MPATRFVRVKVLLVIFLYLILFFQMMGAVVNEAEAYDLVRSREDITENIQIQKVPFGVLISGTTTRTCLTCQVGSQKSFFVTPLYTYMPIDENLLSTINRGILLYFTH